VKVVLDTNVFVSGLMYPDSVPGRIVSAWREARFDLAMSLAQLEEVGRVLAYPKIQRILGWDADRIGLFLKQLFLRAEVVELGAVEATAPRDRDDLPILQTLVQAKADWLVSGDQDLLALREQHSIVTPAEFAARL
jgi:putative PIN family toxin of toxin-antitoxin system